MAKHDEGHSEDDVEPLSDFDQTNGQAPGLEGDDDGAITPEEDEGLAGVQAIVHEVIQGPDAEEDRPGETPYSEEGKP